MNTPESTRRGSLAQIVRGASGVAALLAGCVLAVAVVAVVELGFGAFNLVSGWRNPPPVKILTPPLGTYPAQIHAIRTDAGHATYDVHYTVDSRDSRVTPDTPAVSTGKDLVFFGCSFTFGEGLDDANTLPNQVARLAPEWRVTNLAHPGYGTGQVLQQIQDSGLVSFADGNRAIAVYVYIPAHIERVIGRMRNTTSWAVNFPYYALSSTGELELRGTLNKDRPWTDALYHVLAHEQILKAFGADVPLWITDGHAELTARLIEACRDEWAKRPGQRDFVVLVYPPRRANVYPSNRMIELLEKRGLRCLDYSNRFDGVEGVAIPVDNHPSVKAHQLMAPWIADDLGLRPAAPAQ